MTRNQQTAAAAAVVLLAVIALGAFIYFSVWSGGGTAPVADASPTTEPAPAAPIARPPDIFDVPSLASPDAATLSPNGDPKLTGLIQQHNANLGRIASATLAGTCMWREDKATRDGSPRPMTITWDSATGHATVTCGKDHCELDGGRIAAQGQSAMKIDAMYLVMLRRFNPKDFPPSTPASTRPNSQLVADSLGTSESLVFDAAGRLIRAMIWVDGAPVVGTYSGHRAFGEGGPVLPTVVSVHVPANVFPAAGPDARTIRFTIDPEKSSVKATETR